MLRKKSVILTQGNRVSERLQFELCMAGAPELNHLKKVHASSYSYLRQQHHRTHKQYK